MYNLKSCRIHTYLGNQQWQGSKKKSYCPISILYLTNEISNLTILVKLHYISYGKNAIHKIGPYNQMRLPPINGWDIADTT